MSGNIIKLAAVAAVFASSAFLAGSAHAGTCKTVQHFPGVVQLYATVDGEGDEALCTSTNACPSGAQKVEVFAGGVGRVGTIVAAAASGRTESRDVAVASCDTTLANKHGVGVGVCQAEASSQPGWGNVVENECLLYTLSQTSGKTISNATCFCGE